MFGMPVNAKESIGKWSPFSAFPPDQPLAFLSQLLLGATQGASPETLPEPEASLRIVSREEFDTALALADLHHVTMRGMEVFRRAMMGAGDNRRAEWADAALEREGARITRALSFLRAICEALDSEGCNVVVIKSLDHLPDLGSDLDLYTDSTPAAVTRVMCQRLHARIAARSWGDRLANKWNFVLPGLPEAVEVHVGRLGQTGEQVAFARSLAARARPIRTGGYVFQVPSAEHRLMISTLQRMYRHFYLRLCDLVDTARLLEEETIAYDELRCAARAAGIWEGVATYLSLVRDYVGHYRGRRLDLPLSVTLSASFGVDQIRFRRGFLRLPILPHSALLYKSELATLLRQGELENSARLSLLPGLATAAAFGMRITGSDKGIW